MAEMKTLNGYEVVDEKARSIVYEDIKTVHLGENVLGSATLGDGWAVAYSEEQQRDIYTHTESATADLSFATNVQAGEVYLLRFVTDAESEFVKVGLGDRYRVRCYQGKQTIEVPLYAPEDNATLYFTPDGDGYPSYNIAGMVLRKIQDEGIRLEMALHNTATANHHGNYGFWNTFIGDGTAENAVGTTRSVAIGYETLRDLQGGHRNIGIGTFAMSQMTGGEENVSIGADSMLAVKGAETCVAIGMGAMYEGEKRNGDLAIGMSALKGTETSKTEKNIGIGRNAGAAVTIAKSNIFIGNNAGYKVTSGYSNTLIGDGVAKAATTAHFNTVVGRNAVIPANAEYCVVVGDGATATKNAQAVLGGDTITETLLKGELVVRGTDGVKRQIVFNADGTCSWMEV